ncbi:MAG TPA: hypothetical protein DCG16_03720 [Gemmatimonadetes bacterium]|nr:hypothetical protein [Gemmatimonadota bacterium]
MVPFSVVDPAGLEDEMSNRIGLLLAVICATAVSGVVSTVAAQNSGSTPRWEVPRTPDGHPDLQGNWTNQTLTPLERRGGGGPVYTPEQVAQIEQGSVNRFIAGERPSDPDRAAPRAGGSVGGYNNVYFELGHKVAVVNGEPRSSLITFPSNGRIPAFTPEGERQIQESRDLKAQFNEFDHPELRPIAERCLVSYGSPAGPPMLPTTGYNSNYTIVQTADHVLIMTEMVHDARIIRIGDGPRLPEHVRPWFGDSWGRWEGDVLVVETTNIYLRQEFSGNVGATLAGGQDPHPSEQMKVTERFSRVDEETVLYEFTVDDPTVYTETWGGQIPMVALHQNLYEYACQEGNYGLENILSGARYQERMEAEEASDSRRD